MRGIMFNYFLAFIDKKYGYETVDQIITCSGVQNDGAYANGKLYDDSELFKLIQTTSELLHISPSEIQVSSGRETFKDIFEKLITLYDQDTYTHTKFIDAFDFISKLEEIHYREVVKLYSDSEFPHFDVISQDENRIEIRYRSKRHLPYLDKGFLEGCILYFDEALSLEMMDGGSDSGTRFVIQREAT